MNQSWPNLVQYNSPGKDDRIMDGVAVAPDGTLFTAAVNGTLPEWAPPSADGVRAPAPKWSKQVTGIRDIALSPVGLMLAVVYPGQVELWDISGPEPRVVVKSFPADPDPVSTSFSRDGKVLAVGGKAGLRIWKITGQKSSVSIQGPREQATTRKRRSLLHAISS